MEKKNGRVYIVQAKQSKGTVHVAGWVHEVRDLGKLKFLLLRDRTGLLQITIKKGKAPEQLLALNFHREEVLAITGKIAHNKIAPDGVELIPEKIEVLATVEKKLPVDPSDMVPAEVEVRLDHRYLDLRRKKIQSIFSIKSTLANAFRQVLLSKQFVEIHPTCITGAATEGGTDVFPLQYFENQAFLVQSPQLYKQLCVIGGLDQVFMTVPVFRAEKHNTTSHLNEIIQMDVEMGFANHFDVMEILGDTVLHMLKKTKEERGEELKILDAEINLPKKIPQYTYSELVDQLKEKGFPMEWGEDFSKEAEKKLAEIVGEELFFIYDWPTAVRAFYSMPDSKNEEICHAFDLVYRGLEIASGAQRIHQVDILEKQLKKRGLDPYSFEFYLNAFRLGAPPHAGWSIGLERLTMKVCNLPNIREAMLFPRDRTRLHP